MSNAVRVFLIGVLIVGALMLLSALTMVKWWAAAERYYVVLEDLNGQDVSAKVIMPIGTERMGELELAPRETVNIHGTWYANFVTYEFEGTMYIYDTGVIYKSNNPAVKDLHCFPKKTCMKNAP